MHAETRRDALTRIAQVGLGTTALASLTMPGDEARTHWQTPLPGLIPPGWLMYRENLIANIKPGPLLRSKPRQSSVYLGNGAAITAAHAGVPGNARDERTVSFPLDGNPAYADLLLYRVRGHHGTTSLPIASTPLEPGTPLVHAGLGKHRATPERFAPGIYHYALPPAVCRTAPGPYFSPLFQFESIPFSKETQATRCDVGDSGGLVLAWNPEELAWQLAGLLLYRSVPIAQAVGDPVVLSYAIDLTHPIIRRQVNEYVASGE